MINPKILIVDDLIENIKVIIRMLEQSHPQYRLYQANDARSAIKLTESIALDLIITDWDMPGLSGIDLIRELKENAKTAHIPVIVVTGIMLTPEDLEIAFSAGAHDYIQKPVHAVELCARAHSALTLASSHHEALEKKNLELVEKTLMLIKINEFNISFTEKMHKLMQLLDANPEAGEIVQLLMAELDVNIKQCNWQHFEIAFKNVHANFGKNLLSAFPALTPGEIRLCTLIKLGLNTKEMASLLYQSPESIKVSRSRLRKKLQLPNEANLENFFAAI
jgi:DNA-binding response OmpR family regulator/DNA-binding CsgD family transcriptional regulator